MANDAECENKSLYYSPNGRRLVIEESHYRLGNGQDGNSTCNAPESTTTEYCDSDQPLDLSHISPKRCVAEENAPLMMTKRHEDEESECNGRHTSSSSSPQNVPRSVQYESVSSAVVHSYADQGTVSPRNAPQVIIQQPISPTLAAQSISPVMGEQVVATSLPQRVTPSNGQDQTKTPRPFKAYLQNQLPMQLSYYSLPVPGALTNGSPLIPGVLSGINNDVGFNQFRSQVLEQRYATGRRVNSILNSRQTNSVRSSSAKTDSEVKQTRNVSSPSQSSESDESNNTNNGHDNQQRPVDNSAGSQQQAVHNSTQVVPNNKKRGRSNTDEPKDESYWERRRKNNEAAKRSRDARRAKEDEIAIRAAYLEQENLKLRIQLAALNSGKMFNENEVRMEPYSY